MCCVEDGANFEIFSNTPSHLSTIDVEYTQYEISLE